MQYKKKTKKSHLSERMSTVFSLELLLAILNIQYQGSGSPSTISPEPDYTDYTPLKKRRLANYREAEEEVRAASEKVTTPVLSVFALFMILYLLPVPNCIYREQ